MLLVVMTTVFDLSAVNESFMFLHKTFNDGAAADTCVHMLNAKERRAGQI